MNMKKFLLLPFVLLMACSSNESTSKSEKPTIDSEIIFGKVGQKVFEVDSITDYNLYFPSYYSSKSVLSCLNASQNSVDLYDYESGELQKRIGFKRGEPNNIKADLFGYQLIDDETLFVIDKVGNLYISDWEGKIRKSIYLDPDGIPGGPLLLPNLIPAFQNGDLFYLENYYLGNPSRLMKIALDTASGDVNYQLNLPAESVEGFWGLGDFGYYNCVVNEDYVIYNFPNLDSLYIYDKELNSLGKIIAKSRNIDSPVEKLLDMGNIPPESYLKIAAFTSSIYTRLIHDKYQSLYYRIVGKPINETLLNSGDPIKSTERKYSVVVFDSQFNWKGEFDLPEYEYDIAMERILVTPDGLLIQTKGDSEDVAVFDVFNTISG